MVVHLPSVTRSVTDSMTSGRESQTRHDAIGAPSPSALFVTQNRALFLKHARVYVRGAGEKATPEDVAREMELEFVQLAKRGDTLPDTVGRLDAWLRSTAKHAGGRAKRRRKLVEQIAAGDDLGALTLDLQALDQDLPASLPEILHEHEEAKERLDGLKRKVSPREALVFALLFEDLADAEDVTRTLTMLPEAVAEARAHVLAAATSLGIDPNDVARLATGDAQPEACLEGPLLALIRSGDQADDLNDAYLHVARCPGCRARLTEGTLGQKAFVVVAIEAPRGSLPDLEKATSESGARLFERGTGRWTAVVEAERATELRSRLEQPESSVVNRLAIGTPFEVPVEELRSARVAVKNRIDSTFPAASGTDADEVQAWAQVATQPRQRVWRLSLVWILFAVLAIAGAMAGAYLLATHLAD